jgi:hypothetical protein
MMEDDNTWPWSEAVCSPGCPMTKDQLDYWMEFIDRQQQHGGGKAPCAVAYCGCDGSDWAVIDPTVTPDESDDGVYAHGFASEQEAFDYIEVLKSGPVPGLTYWVPDEALAEWQRRKQQ